ncbi:MAG: hypothetical protein ACTHKP_02250 [Nitrososphaeraceae archaeon]
MDSTLSQHKDFSAVQIKKKIHRISDKSLVVIDENLVRQLSIDEDSWCAQEQVSDGILLKIFRSVQGEQLQSLSLSKGRKD